MYTLPETNSSLLKSRGWNTHVLLGPSLFSGATPWKINYNSPILQRKMIFQTFMRTCSMFNLWGCMSVSGSVFFHRNFFVQFFLLPRSPGSAFHHRVPVTLSSQWNIEFLGQNSDLRFRLREKIIISFGAWYFESCWTFLGGGEVLNLIYTVFLCFFWWLVVSRTIHTLLNLWDIFPFVKKGMTYPPIAAINKQGIMAWDAKKPLAGCNLGKSCGFEWFFPVASKSERNPGGDEETSWDYEAVSACQVMFACHQFISL